MRKAALIALCLLPAALLLTLPRMNNDVDHKAAKKLYEAMQKECAPATTKFCQ
jgi:hypothetical protein